MKRSRIRLQLLAALIVVVLLGLAVWIYIVAVVGPDHAIERAEAFLFRRMTVAQVDESGTYRFHFVTNRSPLAEAAQVDESFGRDRQAELSFGYFDTAIEPSLGLGMIIDPSEWFLNEEIRLRSVAAQERAAFVAQLRAQVESSPHRGLLVVVHGFREAFPSALRRTAFIGHVLDINSPVLLFDWPGNQGTSPAGYRRARQVASDSGAELAETLRLIVREVRPKRLWLMANSLGAQVAVDAFSLLYGDADFADAETEIEDVVLTAPDVKREDFDERFKREIVSLARDLTVYVSSNDRALLIARLIARGQRRGESTLSPDQLDEATQVLDLIEPDVGAITLVDVTPVNRTRNFHNFSLETPEFFDDLFLRLSNEETPRSRLLHRFQTPEGATYWVLTRGR